MNGADSRQNENSLEMAARSAPPLELGFSFDVLLLTDPDVILFILGEILDLLCEEQQEERSEYDAMT